MFLDREKLKSFFNRLSFKRLASGFSVFSTKEKLFFLLLALAGLAGLFLFLTKFYFSRTVLVPRTGGVYVEGIVGHPRFVNPIIPDQNEAEEAVESLVFSSLFKSDGSGGLMPDLAENATVFEDGKVYLVTLRENLFWQDNEKLTVQDVIFTIELFKNPEIQNPAADFWRGVTVEALSDKTVKFTLQKSYRFFPYYLSFKIMPKHIWQDVPASSFVFSEFNLKPIGSGPYKFKKIVQDKDGKVLQYSLVAFDKYYLEGPFLQAFNLKFFGNQTEALASLRKKEMNGLAGVLPESLSSYQLKEILLTQVFSLLFNNDNQLLQEFSVRDAINLSVNKKKIVDEIVQGGVMTDSPVASKDFSEKTRDVFDPETAKEILAKAGWQDRDKDGILEKRISSKSQALTKLELSILYHDAREISNVAEQIKSDLAVIGVSVVLKPMGINEFSSRLQARSYQTVLLGQASITGNQPDLYPFWHSSQISAPGLNFAIYEDKSADRVLADIRNSSDDDLKGLYEELDVLVKNDAPGVFLYLPKLNWLVDGSFRLPETVVLNSVGERFSRANEWHLYLKRVWSR